MLKSFLTLTVLCSAILLTVPLSQASDIGSLTLKSLDRQSVLKLPVTDQPAFIAVGFHPKTQPQLEQALLAVKKLQGPGKRLTVVEIPVVEQKWYPDSAVVRTFMKQRIRNKPLIAHVYPYFTDLRAFQSRLGLQKDEHAIFLLASAQGQILWRKKSPPKAEDLMQIQELID